MNQRKTLKALVISPAAFLPDWEGNRKRVGQMVAMLEEFGFEVHFLFVRQADGDSSRMAAALNGRFHELPNKKRPRAWRPWFLRTRLARLFRAYSFCNFDVDSWYFDEIGALAKQIVEREGIDVVLSEYIFYSKTLELLKGVTTVIDAHDVFADRYKTYLAVGRKPEWFSTSEAGERRALARANFVLAIQDEDARCFRGYGHPGVHSIAYAPPVNASADATRPGRLRLCFLGSANDFNRSALDTYLTRIHPQLQAAGIDFEVVVIGRVCEVFTHAQQMPGTVWRGRVERLEEELASCDALINSLVTGTGLPIKVLDALSSGLHVLATDGGARGLPNRDALRSVIICDDDASWVAAVRQLAQRKREGVNLRAEAIADLGSIADYVNASKQRFRAALMQRLGRPDEAVGGVQPESFARRVVAEVGR